MDLLRLCCLAALVASCVAVYIPGFVNGKPLRYALDEFRMRDIINSNDDVNITDCVPDVQEFYVDARVDNFDSNNTATYKQRYFSYDKYYNKSNGVVFLMLGGEGEILKNWTCFPAYTYIELAQKHQALILQLEHRFFGLSFPFKDANGNGIMDTKSLALLTPQQALADAAAFVKNYNKNNLSNIAAPKWVVYGGSYPGSLCAWFRALYPELTLGGICSSAPLWAKVDFFEYAEVMEYAIFNYNNTCGSAIKSAFTILRQSIFSDDGRKTLNEIFEITPPLNPSSQTYDQESTNFLANMFSSYQGIIQYTFDGRNQANVHGYGLLGLCERVLNSSNDGVENALQHIAEIVSWVNLVEGGSNATTTDNNYASEIAPLQQTVFNLTNENDQENAAMRGWMYLSCGVALGWLQTTDNSNGMFNRMIPINYYFQMCTDLFGSTVRPDTITLNVARTAFALQNPWNFTASNTVLPNGDYDPWSSLGSETNRTDIHQFSIKTHAAAHCSDMYPAYPNEPAGLNHTRTFIAGEVAYYLTLSPSSNNGGGSSISPSAVLLSALIAWILLSDH